MSRPTRERLEEIRKYPDGTYCSTLVKDAVTEIDALNTENHILKECLGDATTALARAIVEFQNICRDDLAEKFERDLQEINTIDRETHKSSYEQIQELKSRIVKLRNVLEKIADFKPYSGEAFYSGCGSSSDSQSGFKSVKAGKALSADDEFEKAPDR